MELDFDSGDFAAAVARIVPVATPDVQTQVPGHAISVRTRIRQFILRRCLGQHRWQQIQKQKRQVECLARVREAIGGPGKPLVVYVVPYDIVKLLTGGGQRIAGIAKAMAAQFRVCILSLSPGALPYSVREISSGVWMVAIPASPEFENEAQKGVSKYGGAASLFAFAERYDLLTEWIAVLDLLSGAVQAWTLVSPMAWPLVRRVFKSNDQLLIYDAHDDMTIFLRDALACGDEQGLKRAEIWEEEVLQHAICSMFCTSDDAGATRDRHPEIRRQMIVVPNGVDVAACQMMDPSRIRANRRAAGVTRPVVLFMGARHKPNHEAVDWIIREIAPSQPQAVFVVMGMTLASYRQDGGAEPGANVVFTGRVSEDIKEAIFSLADIALAPMKSGTGSSLKIPDYVAHGKVVIGTPIGLRGFDALLQFPSVIAEEDVCGALARMLKRLDEDADSLTESCRAAREWVQLHLDWSVAAMPLLGLLEGAQGVESPEWSSIP